MQAILELERMGYRFSIEAGGGLRYACDGRNVDAERARALLGELRANREGALQFVMARAAGVSSLPLFALGDTSVKPAPDPLPPPEKNELSRNPDPLVEWAIENLGAVVVGADEDI